MGGSRRFVPDETHHFGDPRMTARDRTPIVHAPGVLRIPLTRGMFALIDEVDAPLVAPYLWCALKARNTHYAMRVTSERKAVYIHRLLLGLTQWSERADHIDGDGLNNQRSNLRLATHTQNLWNQRKHRHTRSRFVGLNWNDRVQKWQVRARHLGRTVSLGYHADEIEAAKAYDAFVLDTRGEFAVLNFQHVKSPTNPD